jgi:hypothetical protein
MPATNMHQRELRHWKRFGGPLTLESLGVRFCVPFQVRCQVLFTYKPLLGFNYVLIPVATHLFTHLRKV